MRDWKRPTRFCLGGCGRAVQGNKKLRCVGCKVAHGKKLRQDAWNLRREQRREPEIRDLSSTAIERMLRELDAKRRRHTWRAA